MLPTNSSSCVAAAITDANAIFDFLSLKKLESASAVSITSRLFSSNLVLWTLERTGTRSIKHPTKDETNGGQIFHSRASKM